MRNSGTFILSFKKWAIRGVFALAIWILVSFLCRLCTDGFTVGRILSDLPCSTKWQTPSPSEEVLQILSQPFSYFGRGRQCFVFLSSDGNYVIKFSKNRFYKPRELFLRLPLPPFLDQMREEQTKKMWAHIDWECASYMTALRDLPQEMSGLLYLHLCPQEGFNQILTVTDKLGIFHHIPLDKTAFFLQKRGETLGAYLKRAQKEGDEEGAKRAIRTAVRTLTLCATKGIFYRERALQRNLGIGERGPLLIDLGGLKKREDASCPETSRAFIKRITKRFCHFLNQNYPMLTPVLDEEIDAV